MAGFSPASGAIRLRRRMPCGKERPRRAGAPLADSPPGRCCRSSVVEHSLGKGEVVSSILPGSTIKSQSDQ